MSVDLFGDLIPGSIARAQDLNDKFNVIEACLNDFGSEGNGSKGTLGNNSIHEDAIQEGAITQDKIKLTVDPTDDLHVATRQYVDNNLDADSLDNAFNQMFGAIVPFGQDGGSTEQEIMSEADFTDDKWHFVSRVFQAECSGYITIIEKERVGVWVTVMISPSNNSDFDDAYFGKDPTIHGLHDPMDWAIYHVYRKGKLKSQHSHIIPIPKDSYVKIHVSEYMFLDAILDPPENAYSKGDHLAEQLDAGSRRWGNDTCFSIRWSPFFTDGDNDMILKLT